MQWRLPKEHGSWGMFFVPFALGWIAAGSGGTKMLLLLLASTALFLSRENLLFWRRSWRAGRPDRESTRTLLVYAAAAMAAGLPLLLVWRLWLLLPLALLGSLSLLLNAELTVRRQGRTAITEFLAIATSSLNAPAAHYVATGQLTSEALVLWALSTAYFSSSIFYVKLRVQDAHGKKPDAVVRARHACAAYHSALFAGLLLFALLRNVPLAAAAAFAPVIARGLWSVARPSRQLNLKRVGWLEVGYSMLFLIATGLSF
jgi:hypothetical protein